MPNVPTLVQFPDFKRLSGAKGSNQGGFFKNLVTNKEYYIKWLPEHLLEQEKQFFSAQDLAKGKYQYRHRNRFINEYLAARLYQLYAVVVPKVEFITFIDNNGARCFGIASEKQTNIRSLTTGASKEVDKALRNKAQQDFLIDVLLANYDVAGSAMNNIFYQPDSLQLLRLDTGAALKYYARGKAKKDEFDSFAGEFEDLVSGRPNYTPFHPSSLANASKIFKGVYNSPALLISLRKLLAVSDCQLSACVEHHGFDNGDPRHTKGRSKNLAIINQLKTRKQILIGKAKEKILIRLINGLKDRTARRTYLLQAGINDSQIDKICIAIETATKEEVWHVVRAAISPDLITTESVRGESFDEATHFNQIIRDFLHSRAPKDPISYPLEFQGNVGSMQIQRVKHGGMHASRTALHTQKFISLLQQSGYQPALELSAKDKFLIKVAAIFHDTGREIDNGCDQLEWELQSARKCQHWLERIGEDQVTISKVSEAIAYKDDPSVQARNIYALVLAAADSLDWVRSYGSDFNASFMPTLIKQQIPRATLNDLALVAKQIAVFQADSPRDDMGVTGNFNIQTKQNYEHNSAGCYSAIRMAYERFSTRLEQVNILQSEAGFVAEKKPQTRAMAIRDDLARQKRRLLLAKLGYGLTHIFSIIATTMAVITLASILNPIAAVLIVAPLYIAVFALLITKVEALLTKKEQFIELAQNSHDDYLRQLETMSQNISSLNQSLQQAPQGKMQAPTKRLSAKSSSSKFWQAPKVMSPSVAQAEAIEQDEQERKAMPS